MSHSNWFKRKITEFDRIPDDFTYYRITNRQLFRYFWHINDNSEIGKFDPLKRCISKSER